jgi:hypothetical protein
MIDQGVTEFTVNDINDEFVVIKPVKYETYEETKILRYNIQ